MYWIFIIEIEIELASEVDIKYQSRIVNRKPILIFQFLVLIYFFYLQMAPGTHWSELSFKNVNLKSMGQPVGGGNFHPLLKVCVRVCVFFSLCFHSLCSICDHVS